MDFFYELPKGYHLLVRSFEKFASFFEEYNIEHEDKKGSIDLQLCFILIDLTMKYSYSMPKDFWAKHNFKKCYLNLLTSTHSEVRMFSWRELLEILRQKSELTTLDKKIILRSAMYSG